MNPAIRANTEWVSTTFDGTLGRPQTRITRAGTRSYTYVGRHGVIITDEGGRITESYEDAVGRTVATIDALSAVNLMRYTPWGDLMDVWVNSTQTMRNVFDNRGRMTSTYSPDRNMRTYGYNSFDEVTRYEDAIGCHHRCH